MAASRRPGPANLRSAVVLGGRAFEPPKGIGIGRFRFLALWVTEESNAGIRERIEQRVGVIGDVTTERVGKVPLYSSAVKIGTLPARSRCGPTPV